MSTRIDDLPGPGLPDEIQQDLNELQTQSDNLQSHREEYQELDPNQTNVKANIRKKVRFDDEQSEKSDGLIDVIKKEINEENLLLILIVFLATQPAFAHYLQKLPLIGNYTSNDGWLSGLIKAVILIAAYVLLKRYLLPSIKI
jgi:hypothetical protein